MNKPTSDKERAIFFEITNLCNHRCIHCCKQWEDNSEIRTASYETLDKIVDTPKSHLTISGGEPSLVKDKVFYLLEHEQKNISINTNLTYWTKDDIDYFNSSSKISLNISVVSLQKDIYRKIVQADTYDKFLKNLTLVNKDNFITMVVNNISLSSIKFTVKTLLLMGFHNILVTPQVPTPNCSIDANKVMRIIKELHDEYKDISNITTQGYCNLEYCDHICEAGIGRLLIDTKGDVYPCAPIHRECKLGTIGTDIIVLKQRGQDFYYSYPSHLRDVCKGFLDSNNQVMVSF
ncbi:radical SAM protein [Megamonas funiformis]|uniref:radical SAM protein n=1 Tax=Megamonas funiformis TaxID=437897 RepID=UPI003F9D4444